MYEDLCRTKFSSVLVLPQVATHQDPPTTVPQDGALRLVRASEVGSDPARAAGLISDYAPLDLSVDVSGLESLARDLMCSDGGRMVAPLDHLPMRGMNAQLHRAQRGVLFKQVSRRDRLIPTQLSYEASRVVLLSVPTDRRPLCARIEGMAPDPVSVLIDNDPAEREKVLERSIPSQRPLGSLPLRGAMGRVPGVVRQTYGTLAYPAASSRGSVPWCVGMAAVEQRHWIGIGRYSVSNVPVRPLTVFLGLRPAALLIQIHPSLIHRLQIPCLACVLLSAILEPNRHEARSSA